MLMRSVLKYYVFIVCVLLLYLFGNHFFRVFVVSSVSGANVMMKNVRKQRGDEKNEKKK